MEDEIEKIAFCPSFSPVVEEMPKISSSVNYTRINGIGGPRGGSKYGMLTMLSAAISNP
jgi:hypothetical protein